MAVTIGAEGRTVFLLGTGTGRNALYNRVCFAISSETQLQRVLRLTFTSRAQGGVR